MAELRRRLNIGADVMENSEDNRILDEQEQEETINELRQRATSLDKRMILQARTYTVLASIFYLALVVTPGSFIVVNNATAARVLAFLQLLITLKLTAAVFGYGRPSSLTQWFSWENTSALLVMSSIAPLYYLFTDPDPVQTVVWAIAGGVTAIDWAMVHAVREGEADIVELEKLKYNAKGA